VVEYNNDATSWLGVWLDSMHTLNDSVSNCSGLPGFGSGWNRTQFPGPGLDPPSILGHVPWVGLPPALDINERVCRRFEPPPQLNVRFPATLPRIKYLCSDCFMT